jgi:hypothetical protein
MNSLVLLITLAKQITNYENCYTPFGDGCSTRGVGCVMTTSWGANRNVGTSGGVNTGGADPGVSSSSWKNDIPVLIQFRTEYVHTTLKFCEVSRIINSLESNCNTTPYVHCCL